MEAHMAVKPIPDGYRVITPYLIVRGAARAIDFYTKVLGGSEIMRMPGPGDRIGHAEIRFGDSVVMLADEVPEMVIMSPEKYGGSPVSLMIYVQDVDAVFNRAIAAGAKSKKPIQNQFYGDRSGTLVDPFGHTWTIATHVEDVSPEEITRRMGAMKPQLS
jgi:PhnB protein